MTHADGASAAIDLDEVEVRTTRAGRRRVLLRDVTWRVGPGEHWVVLGANGAGKTTLLAVAGARRVPSAGTVTVLGRRIGRTDVRTLWGRIGSVDARAAESFGPTLTATEVVATGWDGSLFLWPDRYGADVLARAAALLETVGAADLADRRFATCSSGERARVLIARALVADPPLLLLDEPAAGLDLAARERLLTALETLARRDPHRATVMVTHHVEEIPRTARHVLLLADGAVAAQGPIEETLTGEAVSRCFGLELTVEQVDGRWAARAHPGRVGLRNR